MVAPRDKFKAKYSRTQYDIENADLCPDDPPDFPCRTPLSTISIFPDVVQIQDSWCFESGHAMQYVDCEAKLYRHDDPELLRIVEAKFLPDVVAEVRKELGLAALPNPPPEPKPEPPSVDHTKLKTLFVDREKYFSLGLCEKTGRAFVAILVANRMVEYSEYYEIEPETFRRWVARPALAHDFVAKAKNRELDHLLLLKPGTDRGWPI